MESCGESDSAKYHFQHDPTVLENGTLMLFDNMGRPEQSNIIEFDPVTNHVIWLYRGTNGEPLFSRTCGIAMRLPNGNTPIPEPDNDLTFEVTQDKRIVWTFYNPRRAGDDGEYIATLFEVVRLSPEFSIGWARHRPLESSEP